MKEKVSSVGMNSFSLSYLFNSVMYKNSQVYMSLVNLNMVLNTLFFFSKSVFFKNNFLNDIFVVDYLFFKKSFKICYNLVSFFYYNNLYIVLSLALLEKAMSMYKFFKSTIWLESEVYDMFGIIFFNNWDLSKILTDYTFFGFPLSKDFPLTGFVEVFYNMKKKSIFEVLLELMQELRFFSFSSNIESWDFQ